MRAGPAADTDAEERPEKRRRTDAAAAVAGLACHYGRSAGTVSSSSAGEPTGDGKERPGQAVGVDAGECKVGEERAGATQGAPVGVNSDSELSDVNYRLANELLQAIFRTGVVGNIGQSNPIATQAAAGQGPDYSATANAASSQAGAVIGAGDSSMPASFIKTEPAADETPLGASSSDTDAIMRSLTHLGEHQSLGHAESKDASSGLDDYNALPTNVSGESADISSTSPGFTWDSSTLGLENGLDLSLDLDLDCSDVGSEDSESQVGGFDFGWNFASLDEHKDHGDISVA